MSKITLSDLGTTLSNGAANTINSNNQLIENALENTLSRDGTSPNQMEADLDLNHNDVINVDNLHVETIVLNGETLTPSPSALPSTVMLKPTYDPQGKNADAFDRVNHTGVQSDSTVVRLTTGPRTGLFSQNLRDRDFQYISPRDFGATGAGTADDNLRILDAIDLAVSSGINRVLLDGKFRSFTPIALTLDNKFEINGRSKFDQLRIDCDNTVPGLQIKKADGITLRNFDLQSHSSTVIINGSGHNGTCLTCGVAFPDLGQPPLDAVKDVLLDGMVLSRANSSQVAHASAFVGRVRGVRIVNTNFIGSPTGRHGNAVLLHWSADSAGVATHSFDFDTKTGSFAEGRTVTGPSGSGYIVKMVDAGTTGTLYLKRVSGTFTNNQVVTDGLGGSAMVNGPLVVGNSALVQAPFLPGQYSYHPNNFVMTNCRSVQTARILAVSSSYDIHVDKFTTDDTIAQLVDLPIGDEGYTFASSEDSGRPRTYSFKDIYGPLALGSGANAVTVIDISGTSTSKQLDADLAAYAGAAYNGMPYQRVQPRSRMFKYDSVSFKDIGYIGGPINPAGSPPYVRQIWMRNTIGNFVFDGISSKGRDNVLGLTVNNFLGTARFSNCDFYGGINVSEGIGVTFNTCSSVQPDNTSPNVYLRGKLTVETTNATGMVAGATSFTLAAPTAEGYPIGTPISYSGGIVYVSEWVDPGDTVVPCTTIPAPTVAGATSLTFDRSLRRLDFINHNIEQGLYGLWANGPGVVRYSGGSISQAGQYGLIADAKAVVFIDGTSMMANGLKKLITPTSTRNFIAATDGSIFAKNIKFSQSQFIDYNFVGSTGYLAGALTDSIFSDTPLLGHTNLATNTLNPFRWENNRLDTGVLLGPLTWSPQLRVGGTALADQTTSGTYSIIGGDILRKWFVITVNTVAALTGSLTVGTAGTDILPPAGDEGVGTVYIQNGLTVSTTPFSRVGSGASVFALNRQGATSYTTLDNTNIQAGTVIRGYIDFKLK